MKVQILAACAAIAAALPASSALAVANATTLGGPQGTGFYGVVDPLDPRFDRMPYTERESGTAGAGQTAMSLDLDRDGVVSEREQQAALRGPGEPRREAMSGPSWASNPPVPAP